MKKESEIVEKKIRCLKPEEIEIRVQQVTEKGAQLLLYKDSRCDKRILDETFGIFGWKDRYEEVKGNLFCTISIFFFLFISCIFFLKARLLLTK